MSTDFASGVGAGVLGLIGAVFLVALLASWREKYEHWKVTRQCPNCRGTGRVREGSL